NLTPAPGSNVVKAILPTSAPGSTSARNNLLSLNIMAHFSGGHADDPPPAIPSILFEKKIIDMDPSTLGASVTARKTSPARAQRNMTDDDTRSKLSHAQWQRTTFCCVVVSPVDPSVAGWPSTLATKAP
ncbi:hypothetical protein QBC37DRAFT_445570, partial [Rhypophila decipiens]